MTHKVKCPYCSARFKWNHMCYENPEFPRGVGITRVYALAKKWAPVAEQLKNGGSDKMSIILESKSTPL